jgi:DNA topoisomerase I
MKTQELPPAVADAMAAAQEAGLRYVSDEDPGLRREARKKSFRYFDAQGKLVKDPAVIDRVNRLAIPPAWTGVWICPSANGHIQATGRDVRGRKQYRYHPDWRATRDATKFERMIAFGNALPKIRQRVARDLRTPGLGRKKVIAAMIRLLEETHIRVGNEEYVRQNNSFGLTTLRDRHVQIRGEKMKFHFVGKSGKAHDIELHDARLAKIVRKAQEVPGQILFQYIDNDGMRQKVSSEDVNAYLREVAGEEFSAKDFRTWAGTVLAALALRELVKAAEDVKPTKKNLRAAIERVAEKLGNTPSVCRKCYVHPAIMDGYLGGETIALLQPKLAGASARAGWRLGMEEMAVLSFLRKKLKQPVRDLSTQLRRSIVESGRARPARNAKTANRWRDSAGAGPRRRR